ncbi:MAG: transposase [Candidatus Riflebacteria bacterium]|nr:transposase [Candidatus Riflebacteria bacterium]
MLCKALHNCHILVTDGCFHGDDKFNIASPLDCEKLEELFRIKLFQLLLDKEKISQEMVNNLTTWRHSGFHVYCGEPIAPENETSMENLGRYIIRASISQERMTYMDQEGKIVYESKDGLTKKEFTPLEWLANICSHIPDPGQQTVRYYGFYSNVSRGKRLKAECDDKVPSISESLGGSGKAFRRNWARLIQKIYEIDPLVCPKCQGLMRVISFIEEKAVIEKILKHLGLWTVQPRPPPRISRPAFDEEVIPQDTSSSDGFFPDPEFEY